MPFTLLLLLLLLLLLHTSTYQTPADFYVWFLPILCKEWKKKKKENTKMFWYSITLFFSFFFGGRVVLLWCMFSLLQFFHFIYFFLSRNSVAYVFSWCMFSWLQFFFAFTFNCCAVQSSHSLHRMHFDRRPSWRRHTVAGHQHTPPTYPSYSTYNRY